MEFPFDINQLFSERVTILDQTLGGGRLTPRRPNHQSQLVAVIDELGKASAKAQMLTTPVTSTIKLQSQQHQLYLMKDGESNGGRGVIIGFLKVGCKKLFLLDKKGVHVEAEPLCVLDFFIAQNLQRHGYGLELFNFMLQDKNLEPELMAFDRPSPKLLSFLAKHYCLTQSVPQVNHFVVFEGFFLNKAVVQLRKVSLRKPDGEIKPYSIMEREVVRQEQRTLPWPFAPPHSPQRSVFSQYSHSVGSSPTRVPPQALGVPVPGIDRDQSPHFPLIERCRARSTRSGRGGSSLSREAQTSLSPATSSSSSRWIPRRSQASRETVANEAQLPEVICTVATWTSNLWESGEHLCQVSDGEENGHTYWGIQKHTKWPIFLYHRAGFLHGHLYPRPRTMSSAAQHS
ncbi:alpha-tubulin N-acetyltransferase 1 isoform X3 [Nerophis lumbriciformis]|uniref:alpha-tubulin N-acetyltransferase 1 isoform X3 n=1 Tax=Nerophis lumbriciformis TaxID=546530 RepID=UPI002AE00E9B|nr:alpha-tubulin N-acetyltransferase 1-like isoform X3 [Nerophis lumbriciformis]